ncbi:MAG: YgdI/YgdR family lipoprotein [Verrucomicrobiaceae bacterium]
MCSFLRLLLLPAACVLASCSMPDLLASTAPHKIKLKDGREVMCSGEPKLQEKTGYYRYRTPDHREAVIRADEVAVIVEKRA